MPRPTSKAELLTAAVAEIDRLWDAVDAVDASERCVGGVCGEWSVKDVLAHLDAWHGLFLEWETVGSAGNRPAMPAEGFTFAETPALNAEIFERCRNDAWDEVVERFDASHRDVLSVIERYSSEDLFTKKRFVWTGSTSIGSYAVSATSSHYAWASKLIRKWTKAHAARGGAG